MSRRLRPSFNTTEAQATDTGIQRAQLEHGIALLIGRPRSLFSIPSRPLTVTPTAIPLGFHHNA